MTTKDSETSKRYRADLKARGGVTFGLSLQPDTAAIVERAIAEYGPADPPHRGPSRNFVVNELIRKAARNATGGDA